MIFWFIKYKGSFSDYLPNDDLYYTWMVMWIGSLIVWALPAVWWPLTFIKVQAVKSIFIAWFRYAVSNFAPVHLITVTVLYLISWWDLIPKEATPNLIAINKEDVKI